MSESAYFEAIRRGDVEALRRLLADDPGLLGARTAPRYAPDGTVQCTGLHAAVHEGQVDVMRVLLDAGIDIDATTDEGRTALHDAIEFGVVDAQQLLIERGATVDVCAAAILGKLDRLRELLDGDAELANDWSTRLSPLGWAAYGNRCDTAAELIARGARMDDGELLCAASVGHVEVGRLLMQHGADPDAIDKGAGGNALHAAASMKYTHDSRPFVEMLLDAGADLDARTVNGQTALDIALARERQQQQMQTRDPALRPKPFAAVAELLRRRRGG